MTTPDLPADFANWPLDKKNAFINALKYKWEFWARPDQLMPDLTDPWDIWMILSGRGWGKLLTLSEKILTTSGWSTMGDLTAGDYVFAPDGSPTLVIGAYDTEVVDEYILKFSDGVEISAADTHEWVTWTYHDRKIHNNRGRRSLPTNWWEPLEPDLGVRGLLTEYGPQVRTTQNIADTLRVRNGSKVNHLIPLTKPLQFPEIETAVDPYMLGQWLGDGCSNYACIACPEQDFIEIRKYIEGGGYTIKQGITDKIKWNIGGLTSGLRREEVFKNKHIPAKFEFASYTQRLDLVQGLMDSDGSVHSYGGTHRNCIFTNTNKQIIDMMMKLLRSLGQKPVLSRSESWSYGDRPLVRYKDRFDIKFTPTIPVFKLPRKLIASLPKQHVRSTIIGNTSRTIVDVVKTGRKVPMRCIKVAHPSSLFLVGEGLIPTHNTRTGAEAIRTLMTDNPNSRVGIIGMTAGAVRDTCYEGTSGLVEVMPSSEILKYNRSLGQLTLKNGSRSFSFSGADPEKLRGFQSSYLWMDEISSFQYPQETWDMALLGLRLGDHPRIIVTTTPKPSELIKELVGRGQTDRKHVILTTGSTFDNAANLPESTLAALRERYEGTTMGRQELYAELILDDPGALWTRTLIDANRVPGVNVKDMAEIVVAIDPSMSVATERESETGIIIAGRSARDGKCYILEDCSRLRPSPQEWAQLAIAKYHEYQANRIVAEVNQGYDLVTNLLNTLDGKVPVKKVFATRGGKFLRAEPIAALYEQGRVKHVGLHAKLEDQMTQWVPGKPSPDRLDAMVWAVTQLMLGGGIAEFFNPNAGLRRLPGIV